MAREFRVFGPPGTGKTRYVAEQSRRATQKYGAGAVVIASLTRAAATEIAGRDSDVPPQNIGTLHAHAYRALGRPALAETSEGLKEWNAFAAGVSPRYQVSDKSSVDPENYSIEQGFAGTEGEALLAEVAMRRARMQSVDFWPARTRRFYELWQSFKDKASRADFTDLIEVALADIEVHPSRPMAFFLDEAQDMSRLELQLARKWGERCDVFVIVGDPFQNLYEWRGSEPEAFTSHEAEEVKVLSQSYRVPVAVHGYAVAWAKQITSMEFPAYQPRDEQGSTTIAQHTWSYPDTLLRDLETEVNEGRTAMVLASCSYMLAPLIGALKDTGLPFHNPYRTNNGAWNPMRGAQRLIAFTRPKVTGDMWTWVDVHKWADPLAASDVFKRGAKSFIESKGTLGKFDRENELPPIELQTLLDLLKDDAARDAVFDQDIDWYLRNVRASKKQQMQYPVRVAKKYGLEALRKQPKIIVGTIHSVKGGEADSVYVFPDLSRAAARECLVSGNGSIRPTDALIRQFYVAFTRARHNLILCNSSGSSDAVTFPRPKVDYT